jgi:hypothetical protein
MPDVVNGIQYEIDSQTKTRINAIITPGDSVTEVQSINVRNIGSEKIKTGNISVKDVLSSDDISITNVSIRGPIKAESVIEDFGASSAYSTTSTITSGSGSLTINNDDRTIGSTCTKLNTHDGYPLYGIPVPSELECSIDLNTEISDRLFMILDDSVYYAFKDGTKVALDTGGGYPTLGQWTSSGALISDLNPTVLDSLGASAYFIMKDNTEVEQSYTPTFSYKLRQATSVPSQSIVIPSPYFSLSIDKTMPVGADIRVWVSDDNTNWKTWSGSAWSVTAIGHTIDEIETIPNAVWEDWVLAGDLYLKFELSRQSVGNSPAINSISAVHYAGSSEWSQTIPILNLFPGEYVPIELKVNNTGLTLSRYTDKVYLVVEVPSVVV